MCCSPRSLVVNWCTTLTTLISLLTHHKTHLTYTLHLTQNKTVSVNLSTVSSSAHQLWFDWNKSLISFPRCLSPWAAIFLSSAARDWPLTSCGHAVHYIHDTIHHCNTTSPTGLTKKVCIYDGIVGVSNHSGLPRYQDTSQADWGGSTDVNIREQLLVIL